MDDPLILPSQGLDEKQLHAIAALEERVVARDGGRLKLEWTSLHNRPADQVRDVLCWSADRDRLLGFAGLYGFGHGVPELAGMVDPEFRRQGIGGELLAVISAELRRRGEPRVLLIAPRNGAGGAAFATRHGASLEHSEHAMVLSSAPVEQPTRADVQVRLGRRQDLPELAAILRDAFGHTMLDDAGTVFETETQRRLVITVNGEVAGGIRAVIDGDEGRIYGFAIKAQLRGQGIGGEALRRVCAELFERGLRRVSLEVLSDNDSALGLYESVGFRRSITEDYYELSV